MGDGTEQNPFTREDVLRLIEKNGGEARFVDLSGKVFEEDIDLHDINLMNARLKGAILRGANFEGSLMEMVDLEGADLRGANFQKTLLCDANLQVANLSGADLRGAALGGDREGYVVGPAAWVGSANLRGANLAHANLEEAQLGGCDLEEAQLHGANLKRTKLWESKLKGAVLFHADLQEAGLYGAYMEETQLQGAKLQGANLEQAYLNRPWLLNAEISSSTRLEEVSWGSGCIVKEEEKEAFLAALEIYRNLKNWYTNAGVYDVAGEFFFREMTAKRKALKWWPNPFPRIWSKFISLICGYGERPLRVIIWAASGVVILALIYFIIGSVWKWWAFWNSLYFSAVSFTALGYGSWLQVTNDWIRGIGAFESFIGVFTIALFLITFVRKMTR